MADQSKFGCVGFAELAIKEIVWYNPERDELEGLEYFGDVGKSKYLANHSVMFMLRGLACKWKKAIGYFVTSSTKSPDLLDNIHLKCSKLFHLFIAGKQYQDLPNCGQVVAN